VSHTIRSASGDGQRLVLLQFHTGRDRSVSVGFWGKNHGFGRFRFFGHHQNQLLTASDNAHAHS